MTISYTWAVPNNGVMTQTVNGNEHTIVRANYTITGSDGTHSVTLDGHVEIPTDQNGSFTPFSEVTQEQVINWVKSTLGTTEISILENVITRQISSIQTPPVIPALTRTNW